MAKRGPERGGMSVGEAGRRGGRLISERYGPGFYQRIGKKGGAETKRRHGEEFFSVIGKKGGAAVLKKHGREHYERIGRKGGYLVSKLIEAGKRATKEREERKSTETPS